MSGTLPNRFMIERRYGPSNCDWLHEELKDVPVWTLCAKHALIFKSLAEAAQKLKEIKASAKSWPNRDFFSFAIIEAAASGLAISPPSSPSPSPEFDMPRYRASRFINTREADSYDFSAANGQEALETLLSGDNLAWSGDADLIDCDVPGEILALDRPRTTAVTRPSQRKSSFLAKCLMASSRGISCGKPPNLAKRAPIATLSKPRLRSSRKRAHCAWAAIEPKERRSHDRPHRLPLA